MINKSTCRDYSDWWLFTPPRVRVMEFSFLNENSSDLIANVASFIFNQNLTDDTDRTEYRI